MEEINKLIKVYADLGNGSKKYLYTENADKIVKRKQWHTSFPNKFWLEDLSPLNFTQRCAYITLLLYANRKTNEAFPSTRRLANDLDAQQKTMIRAIRDLEKFCFVEIIRKKGRHNRYKLLVLPY